MDTQTVQATPPPRELMQLRNQLGRVAQITKQLYTQRLGRLRLVRKIHSYQRQSFEHRVGQIATLSSHCRKRMMSLRFHMGPPVKAKSGQTHAAQLYSRWNVVCKSYSKHLLSLLVKKELLTQADADSIPPSFKLFAAHQVNDGTLTQAQAKSFPPSVHVETLIHMVLVLKRDELLSQQNQVEAASRLEIENARIAFQALISRLRSLGRGE